jgi:hypothetical protein
VEKSGIRFGIAQLIDGPIDLQDINNGCSHVTQNFFQPRSSRPNDLILSPPLSSSMPSVGGVLSSSNKSLASLFLGVPRLLVSLPFIDSTGNVIYDNDNLVGKHEKETGKERVISQNTASSGSHQQEITIASPTVFGNDVDPNSIPSPLSSGSPNLSTTTTPTPSNATTPVAVVDSPSVADSLLPSYSELRLPPTRSTHAFVMTFRNGIGGNHDNGFSFLLYNKF